MEFAVVLCYYGTVLSIIPVAHGIVAAPKKNKNHIRANTIT